MSIVMPVGAVPHLYTLPVGVVPQYRPCLLVNCHCNRNFTSWVQMGKGWLHVWCYMYTGAIISDMSADAVSLSDMPACTVQQPWSELLRKVMH